VRGLGVDAPVLQRFTPRFAGLEPEAFVRDFILAHVTLVQVVVGYNVNSGRARAGSAETLRALGERYGFGVDVVGPVQAGASGEQVSSTRLRELLAAGDLPGVRRLLGRPWALRGRVVVGDRRGRTLGFPTANVHVRSGLVLPPDGVYAATVGTAAGPRGARPPGPGRRASTSVSGRRGEGATGPARRTCWTSPAPSTAAGSSSKSSSGSAVRSGSAARTRSAPRSRPTSRARAECSRRAHRASRARGVPGPHRRLPDSSRRWTS